MMTRTSSPRRLVRASVLGAACALLGAACSTENDPAADPGALPSLGEAELKLQRALDCDDLLARIQDSVLVQLRLRAEQLKTGSDPVYGVPGVARGGVDEDSRGAAGGAGGTGGDFPSAATDGDVPQGQPAVSPGNAGAEADPLAPTPAPSAGEGGDFSGTTVQVKDVDEADIVKTEGDRIYLLHGGTLFVIAGWPADATQILGSTPIEGTPAEMFIKDGKAVVFSRVYAELAPSGMTAPADVYYGYSGYTKLTVLDVSGSEPSVLRESFVEGDYNSARRHDDVVRAVVQDGFKIPPLGNPNIEYRDPFGQPYPQADIDAQVDAWLERTTRSIRGTDLGDWLPRELTREDGELVAVAPRCADHYSPAPGLTESGVTSVVSLDLADVEAPLGGATILGNAERVYANADVVLVTQTDYRFAYEPGATPQTIIHRFDLDAGSTSYTASGAVPGSIHNQFSLDERDGIIRVSTTEQPGWGGGWFGRAVDVAAPGDPAVAVDVPAGAPASTAPAEEPAEEPAIAPAPEPEPDAPREPPPTEPSIPPERPTSVSRVLTLGVDGDTLEVLGATDAFGATEQIFATRFIGDRGYVVTFRQTDPLFVIDLADPTAPRVVGELHIPGFSNYLFPLDDDHLFAIGRDATEQGVVQGLALQIFDVSDPTSPELAHKYVFPDQGDSPANVDHRAISFHPDRGIVAFPHQSWQTGESTLEVFEVSSAAGFERLGGMGLGDMLDLDQCLSRYYGIGAGPELEEIRAQLANDPVWQREILASCRYGNFFRRGLFRDDFVYGVSNTGIFVYDLGAMEAGAVSTLSLPAEVYAERADWGGIAVPDVAPPPSMGVGGAEGEEVEPEPASAGSSSSAAAGTGAGGASGDGS